MNRSQVVGLCGLVLVANVVGFAAFAAVAWGIMALGIGPALTVVVRLGATGLLSLLVASQARTLPGKAAAFVVLMVYMLLWLADPSPIPRIGGR